MPTQTVSVQEASKALQVHPNTLRRWLNEGRLQGVKLGGATSAWRIKTQVLKQALQTPPGSAVERATPIKNSKTQTTRNPIYAFVSLKGGVGKTTSAFHFATVIASRGFPVVLIDADPQESGMAWARLARQTAALPFEVVSALRDGLAIQAKQLAEQHVVVIDTPPNAEDLFQQACLVSDLCIMPVAPTVIDLERLGKSIRQLQNLEAIRPELNSRILVVRHSSRENLSKEAVEQLRMYPVLESTIRDLKHYKASFGTTPRFLDEYEAVYREVTE